MVSINHHLLFRRLNRILSKGKKEILGGKKMFHSRSGAHKLHIVRMRPRHKILPVVDSTDNLISGAIPGYHVIVDRLSVVPKSHIAVKHNLVWIFRNHFIDSGQQPAHFQNRFFIHHCLNSSGGIFCRQSFLARWASGSPPHGPWRS